MPTYLLKGKDQNQVERNVRILAESGSSAQSTLAAQGWTELKLLTDDFMEMAGETMDSREELRDQITPDLEAACMEGRSPTLAQQWMRSLRESWMELAFLAGILALGVYLALPFMMWLSGAGILFFVFVTPALSLYFGLPLRYFNRLNKAKVWAKWDEVLHCVHRLEQLRRFNRIGPGLFDLARCRAQALAAKGRVDEGLAIFKAYENSPEIPRWFYLSQLSTIYNTAGQYEKVVETIAQVLALKPDSSVHWLELSCTLSRYLGRLAEAQEALSRVKVEDLPELGRPHVQVAHGMLAWRKGQFIEAKDYLEQAIKGFTTMLHMPLIESCVYLAKAELCAVLGAMGERDQAAQLFKQVEPFLIAHKEVELLQACRDGLGSHRG